MHQEVSDQSSPGPRGAQGGQATMELAMMGTVLAVMVLAILYGAQLLAADIRLNGASRAAAFAAARNASQQILAGTLTPEPTAVANAVGSAVAQNLPNEAPTVTITSRVQQLDSGAGSISMPFYTVSLQELHGSFGSLAPTVHLGSTAGAPVPPVAGQQSASTTTSCGVDVPGFPQQPTPSPNNQLPKNTGYYYVFSEIASGPSNDISATWNPAFAGTAPYPNPNTLKIAIYKGTPAAFANPPGQGTLTTAPPGGAAVQGQGSGAAGTGGTINTITTATAGNGTAQTYTVYFWNGSTQAVVTAPAGVETGEQGAQVSFYQANNSNCSS